jgi:predicted enzyme related to lactoylglutathione lyase
MWHFTEHIMQTKINWFEIPANDFSRAVQFYEAVFEKKLRIEQFGSGQLVGVFTNTDGESFGGVMHGEGFVPGKDGTVIYLDAGPAIDAVIARIKKAGGQIRMDKLALPDSMGFIAHFIDTEGNRLALHALA